MGTGFLVSIGDFGAFTVSRDCRIVSSVIDDAEGVTRRVEAGGVLTMVDVEGGLSIGRSGGGCILMESEVYAYNDYSAKTIQPIPTMYQR